MWIPYLIIGTLFPPALLWGTLTHAQTGGAWTLGLLAAGALAAFGYVVWVLLFVRMGEIAAEYAEADRRGPKSPGGHSCR